MAATSIYDSIRVLPTTSTDVVTKVGIGSPSFFKQGVWENIQIKNLESRLNSIPQTPKLTPKFIGMDLPNEWNDSTPIPSSSKLTTEQYDKLFDIDTDIFNTPRSLI